MYLSLQYMRDSRGAKCSLSFPANTQDGALGQTGFHPYPPSASDNEAAAIPA